MSTIGPNTPAEILPYGRRVGQLRISGVFDTADAEIWDMAGTTYSFEQKFSRGFQRHLVKAGFRFMRETGGRSNPEIPKFIYQNYADLLANIPTQQFTSYGAPPHGSHMDNYSAFLQDDWRLGNNFVLNLGLRYDYYGTIHLKATSPVEVEIVNFEAATDLRKLDFGALRDPQRPYEPDSFNLGPRVGLRMDVERGGVDSRAWWRRLPLQPAPDCDSSSKRGEPVHPVQDYVQPDRNAGQEHQVADVHRRHSCHCSREKPGAGRASSRYSTPTSRSPTPSSQW